MARDHAWFALRYLPAVHPVFREHLPFGFWPAAAAIRVLGEWAVPIVYSLFTLGAVAAAGRNGGVFAMLLLGTCASIWQYGGRLLLDPPLLCFATWAVAFALEERWIGAAVCGAIATLVKGPFGFLPLACVVAARRGRGWPALLGAAAPLAIFLALDPAGGWRTAYLQGQLLASATGARGDGVTAWWFPLAVIARRFWPGLPFALYGLRKRDPLAIACVLLVALLCVPARKWGNHAYVAFPLLAALGGTAVRDVRVRWLAPAVAVGALVFCLGGFGARLLKPPCAFSTALREPLAAVHGDVYVVSKLWDPWAQLAAERDLVPWPVEALPETPSLQHAVVTADTPVPAAWTVTARGGGFLLLRAARR
jgi:hypothetical protein